MSARSGKVQTVLGLVDPTVLGHTQTHEHLLLDLSPRLMGPVPAGAMGRAAEPIRPDNYYWNRRNWNSNPDNLRLLSESDAIAEMHLYRASGGGTVVDATSIGIARDPLGLARISRATGVHVVMGAGYYVADFHPPAVQELTEQQITEQIVGDIVEGVDGTGLRSGIIGEIGLTWPVHPNEATVLRAAARAQVETGAALLIHPGRDPAAPLHAMRIVGDAGGDLERTIISHIDRTLFSLDAMLALAATGCYVELDLFGQESSYYPLAPIDMPNDATRIDYLRGLIAAGHRDKLVIAQDICKKVNLTRYGGEGYTHILENVVPIMRRKGMSTEEVDAILIHNPARILAFV
jgi:phosphotriesterase-related protein